MDNSALGLKEATPGTPSIETYEGGGGEDIRL